MQSIAFAAPYVPGKLEKDREAMRSVSEGDRKAAHDASRKRHGVSREAVWLQQTPEGDMAIVYLEAEDLAAAFASLAASQDPFDQWFRDVVEECHGIDLAQAPAPPAEQMLDYRRT